MGAHHREASTLLPGDPLPGGGVAQADNMHWSMARKEEVLTRLDRGQIGLNDALARWNLTVEEIEAWRRSHKVYGRRGLRLGMHRAEVPRPTTQGQLL